MIMKGKIVSMVESKSLWMDAIIPGFPQSQCCVIGKLQEQHIRHDRKGVTIKGNVLIGENSVVRGMLYSWTGRYWKELQYRSEYCHPALNCDRR